MQKIDTLLRVDGTICHMRIGASCDVQRNAVLLGVKSDIYLIVMKVCAGREQRGIPQSL